jgi:hypothetical protein
MEDHLWEPIERTADKVAMGWSSPGVELLRQEGDGYRSCEGGGEWTKQEYPVMLERTPTWPCFRIATSYDR